MNNILIFIIIISNIVFSEDKILWDLGVIIKNNQQNQHSMIKPLLSNTQIKPSYGQSMKNLDLLDISTLSIPQNHIINLLSLNQQYAKLAKYIQQDVIKDEELTDVERLIYADALYQLGDYNKGIENLNLLSPTYPIDEKYFILALYNNKAGNIKQMVNLLNDIINKYPDSDYYKLAQLQIRGLK
tara:strand:+ start:113 stop:667 length:555 start_codon:yes stop_codon:yes gene_type:complete